MATDADVIRCASPWPGVAAQLVEAFAALGEGDWKLERICAANAISIAPGDALQVLHGLQTAGICTRVNDEDIWRTQLNKAELNRLVMLLRGAEHYRRLRLDGQNLELVVTMPMAPSQLGQELPGSVGRPGGYLPTKSAFLRIANSAQKRLIVMMPFIDSRGFGWLRDVFEAANADIARTLILRDVEKYAVELSVLQAQWLRGLGIGISDYCVAHDQNRGLPLETFHAKIVLADDRLAYVGSANILGSGDGTSLETGVLVDGQAARQVARLVEGVLRVAREVSRGRGSENLMQA